MGGVLEVKGALVFIFSSFFSFLSSHSHRGIKYRLRYGISLRLGNGLDIGITTGGPTTLSKDMDIMMGGRFCSCLVFGLLRHTDACTICCPSYSVPFISSVHPWWKGRGGKGKRQWQRYTQGIQNYILQVLRHIRAYPENETLAVEGGKEGASSSLPPSLPPPVTDKSWNWWKGRMAGMGDFCLVV